MLLQLSSGSATIAINMLACLIDVIYRLTSRNADMLLLGVMHGKRAGQSIPATEEVAQWRTAEAMTVRRAAGFCCPRYYDGHVSCWSYATRPASSIICVPGILPVGFCDQCERTLNTQSLDPTNCLQLATSKRIFNADGLPRS